MSANTSGTEWEPSQLRQLLLAAGVGSRHSYRKLARQSGHGVSRETWRRLTLPIPAAHVGSRWRREVLDVVADTLRKLGERVTADQLERAMFADLGYVTTYSGDDLSGLLAGLQSLSDADLRRLLHEVALLLAPEPDTPADQSRSGGIGGHRP